MKMKIRPIKTWAQARRSVVLYSVLLLTNRSSDFSLTQDGYCDALRLEAEIKIWFFRNEAPDLTLLLADCSFAELLDEIERFHRCTT